MSIQISIPGLNYCTTVYCFVKANLNQVMSLKMLILVLTHGTE